MEVPKVLFALIASSLTVGVGIWYVYRVVIRSDKAPHIVTWGLLTAITGTAFAAQTVAGAGLSATVLLLAAICNFINFCIAWRKRGRRDINRSSTASAVLALLAIILWRLSGEPLLATIFLTIASLLAFAPTVSRTWHEPHLEVQGTYWVNTLRYLLATFAVSRYSLATMLFPATWVVVNGAFSLYHVYCLRQQGEILSASPTRLARNFIPEP